MAFSHYTWDLYDYLVESGMQERTMAPKHVWFYDDGYALACFQVPYFDQNGIERNYAGGGQLYALISTEDGHIIHYGTAESVAP